VRSPYSLVVWLGGFCAVALSAGCCSVPRGDEIIPPDVPIELNKTTFPEHVIEPPDILQIEALQALPRSPYKIHVLDVLAVAVAGTLPDKPIAGQFLVDSDGMLNLGPPYKSVKIAELTVEEAQKAIETRLMSKDVGLKEPQASVTVLQARAVQQIAGEHLVRADGTVYLGTYGSVRVTGLTLTQARQKIEEHLAAYLSAPQITVDVLAYNSKVLYVIFDGAGVGQQVYRLPVTGNETVLDAISQVNGLGLVSDQNHIWVARPAPKGTCDQVLPVDWCGITQKGQTATNYQLLPGDRVFVKAYRLSTVDTTMARVFSPIERALGITLLGTTTARQIRFFQQFQGTGNGGGGIP
jgi:polysaccharide export outer membrane protein